MNEVLTSWNRTGDYEYLQSYFVERVLDIVSRLGNKAAIVWQEVFDNGDQINHDTLVQVWKGWGRGWRHELADITRRGHYGLLSAGWYLNDIKYGADWVRMYDQDPQDFGGTQEEKNRVLGGEACIWGEFVNTINLIPRAWPRASAVAERLWSSNTVRDIYDASERLQEHECRMLARGFPVQPSVGAGFCDVVWDRRRRR